MPREPIELECTECGRRNYSTSKNTRKRERLQVRKYCKWCRKHTVHKEVK